MRRKQVQWSAAGVYCCFGAGAMKDLRQPLLPQGRCVMQDDAADPKRPNKPMPVVFAAHGSPMNALADNGWTQAFTQLGRSLPRPKVILTVSAHWYVDGTLVMAQDSPRTIHDFGGFPKALYEIQYPAPGDVVFAQNLAQRLAGHGATLSDSWGLDHGTWSVLKWMYPQADIPVVQLSLDRGLGVQEHFALAQDLAPLRDEGVLILGSGNIVHNLRDAFSRMQSGDHQTPDWAARFDAAVCLAVLERDTQSLLELMERGDDGALAHPTPDHWLPFVYALACANDHDEITMPTRGFDLGSISMTSVVWGHAGSEA